MKKKILVPVKVSERLPEEADNYFTIDSDNYHSISYFNSKRFEVNEEFIKIDYWYEGIEVEEGGSKKILPNDDRIVEDAYTEEIIDYCGIINNYHKALEAAENEILVLKAENSKLEDVSNYLKEENNQLKIKH